MQPGQVVAQRFEIQALAESGAMAAIYRSRDLHTGRTVAVKVLHGWATESASRFHREARVLAALRHPGIVRHIAHGQVDEAMFLAMEWLDGEDLAKRLARSPLSIAECIRLIGHVADALAAVHAGGVVHRDIKPANLFLVGGDASRVKLVDFGIAHRPRGRRRMTATGVIVGTPGYMAPEQAQGARDIDARADVFALGCVLYKCLTGVSPFDAEDMVAMVAKVLVEDVPPASSVRPDVPAELDDLLARMLHKDPARRPTSAAVLAAELDTMGTVEMPAPELPSSAPAAARARRDAGGGAAGGPTPRRLLGARERRLLSVVLLRGPGARSSDPVDEGGAAQRLAAAHFGARIERLPSGVSHGGTASGPTPRRPAGAPIATLAGLGAATDQALQAVRCAIAMRALLAEDNGPRVPAIAVATGLGELDGALPFGEVVERARALLRGLPRGVPGDIHVDPVTAGLLAGRFDVLRGAGGALDPAGAPLRGLRPPRPPTPLAGREFDLSVLHQLLAECAEERSPRAVVLTGPAGVGKSRLLHELVARIGATPRLDQSRSTFSGATGGPEAAVWCARCDPARAGVPLGVVGQLVGGAAGVAGHAPLDERRRQIAARTAGLDPGAAVKPDDPAIQAFRALMAAEAAPVLAILDDVQWADAASVSFLDAVLRAARAEPLMIIAAGRPELTRRAPDLFRDHDLRAISLGPLPRKACDRLARAALGEDRRARVIERGGGIPLHLEELVLAASEGLDGIPEPLLAAAVASLEALGPEARRVLRAASVFGEVFWRDGVVAVLGGAEGAARADRWLDKLVERDLVAPREGSRFAGHAEYAFCDLLTRDAARATLTREDRALCYELAGAWLSRAGAGEAAAGGGA